MWLKIEGHRMVNVTLVDVVEFKHRHPDKPGDPVTGTATLWSGGVNIVSDSTAAFEYFSKLPEDQFAK